MSLLCRLKGERTKKTFEPNGTLDSATPKPKSHECETCIMRYYTYNMSTRIHWEYSLKIRISLGQNLLENKTASFY